MKIPKEYAYLFNGSKWYYDFTEEEKAIYSEYTQLAEHRREKLYEWIPRIISVASLIISLISIARSSI